MTCTISRRNLLAGVASAAGVAAATAALPRLSVADEAGKGEAGSVGKLVCTEEHFMDPEVDAAYQEIFQASDPTPAALAKAEFVNSFVAEGLVTEIADRRIAFMDENGVDTQVLSYGNNSPMYLDAADAIPLCRKLNDNLAAAISRYPDRFVGCAALPVADPQAAADELDRAVNDLGFKGVFFNGTYQGQFFDNEKFFPIFQKAAELGVPVCLHPGEVPADVTSTYYMGDWPMGVTTVFSGHGIGWHYDAGVQYLRLIFSGMLDKLPDLKLLCGHWGELLPYYIERYDEMFTQDVTGLERPISDYLKNNFWYNASGMFYTEALKFCLNVFGSERILWATDYPYVSGIANARQTLLDYDFLTSDDKENIAHKNAETLFGL